jgi:hypothetical protein
MTDPQLVFVASLGRPIPGLSWPDRGLVPGWSSAGSAIAVTDRSPGGSPAGRRLRAPTGVRGGSSAGPAMTATGRSWAGCQLGTEGKSTRVPRETSTWAPMTTAARAFGRAGLGTDRAAATWPRAGLASPIAPASGTGRLSRHPSRARLASPVAPESGPGYLSRHPAPDWARLTCRTCLRARVCPSVVPLGLASPARQSTARPPPPSCALRPGSPTSPIARALARLGRLTHALPCAIGWGHG